MDTRCEMFLYLRHVVSRRCRQVYNSSCHYTDLRVSTSVYMYDVCHHQSSSASSSYHRDTNNIVNKTFIRMLYTNITPDMQVTTDNNQKCGSTTNKKMCNPCAGNYSVHRAIHFTAPVHSQRQRCLSCARYGLSINPSRHRAHVYYTYTCQ